MFYQSIFFLIFYNQDQKVPFEIENQTTLVWRGDL